MSSSISGSSITLVPDSRGAIAELMGKVLAEVGGVPKAQTNEHFHYKFRGIDDMVRALNPAMAKHGVFCVPRVLSRESDGKRTLLEVEYRFYAPDGTYIIAGPVWGEAIDGQDKGTNKALTAAWKYLLTQVFCISDGETADADADGPPPEPKARKRGAHPAGSRRQAKPVADEEKAKAQLIDDCRDILRARYANAGAIQENLRKWFPESYSSNMNELSAAELVRLREGLELANPDEALGAGAGASAEGSASSSSASATPTP